MSNSVYILFYKLGNRKYKINNVCFHGQWKKTNIYCLSNVELEPIENKHGKPKETKLVETGWWAPACCWVKDSASEKNYWTEGYCYHPVFSKMRCVWQGRTLAYVSMEGLKLYLSRSIFCLRWWCPVTWSKWQGNIPNQSSNVPFHVVMPVLRVSYKAITVLTDWGYILFVRKLNARIKFRLTGWFEVYLTKTQVVLF